MRQCKVLVVDDSLLMQRIIGETLRQDKTIEVVGYCTDGAQVAGAIERLRPDLITLDLELPKLNGLGVLKHVIQHHPLPVIVVSGVSNKGAALTLECLALGASDFILKPRLDQDSDSFKAFAKQLVEKVHALVVASQGTQLERGQIQNHAATQTHPVDSKKLWRVVESREPFAIVGIGASTGGPRVVEQVLERLHHNSPPVLVAVHMPASFTALFAQRMAKQSSNTNWHHAASGMPLEPGHIYLCPGEQNLSVIRLSNDQWGCELKPIVSTQLYRPSIDTMFKSLAQNFGAKALGIVLSGMGRDGLAGSKAISAQGGWVITQDEASSALYGMPKVVAEAGLSNQTLNPNLIAQFLQKIQIGAIHE